MEKLCAKHSAYARSEDRGCNGSKSETRNAEILRELHLKGERQINNYVIQAIHYGIIEEKVLY